MFKIIYLMEIIFGEIWTIIKIEESIYFSVTLALYI
jgi:hypothetical protein